MRKSRVSVMDRLAADIQAGGYSPGTWLKQIDLQKRYGANRSEIRKALEGLANKRLIRYETNRGYYVHREDDHVEAEIQQIRIMLEVSAADYMVAHATEAQIVALRALAQTFLDLLSDGTILDIYEANLAFHAALLASSGNHSLVELVSELRLRTPPAPASQWSTRSRVEQSGLEHVAMVEALADRDAPRLRQIIRNHITQDAQSA